MIEIKESRVERTRAHIEAKFADAPLLRYPFPHLIIEEFFPNDVYEKILQYNPFHENSGDEWFSPEVASRMKTKTPYWMRKQINFHKGQSFKASPEQKDFWNEISECFLADSWFVRLVIQKYKEYFILRFGELTEADNFPDLFAKKLFLQRHEPGYDIGPHTDIPPRIFTCIFAFADREGFEEYGTCLCAPRDPMVRCWGNNHYQADDFIVTKIAPYRPNNFFLFFKTRQSFHSVKAIDEKVPNQRYGMQFQLYEPNHGLFRDLSEPDLMVPDLQS